MLVLAIISIAVIFILWVVRAPTKNEKVDPFTPQSLFAEKRACSQREKSKKESNTTRRESA